MTPFLRQAWSVAAYALFSLPDFLYKAFAITSEHFPRVRLPGFSKPYPAFPDVSHAHNAAEQGL